MSRPAAIAGALISVAMLVIGGRTAAVELVIEAALAGDGGFRELALPDRSQRALIWSEGVLTSPDSIAWHDDGAGGLLLVLDGDRLAGVGPKGRFDITPGRYDLDTPLLLGDGRVTILIDGGQLDVTNGGLTYRRPPAGRDPRSDFAILAGLLIAIAVLLRSLRRRTRGDEPARDRRGRRP